MKKENVICLVFVIALLVSCVYEFATGDIFGGITSILYVLVLFFSFRLVRSNRELHELNDVLCEKLDSLMSSSSAVIGDGDVIDFGDE